MAKRGEFNYASGETRKGEVVDEYVYMDKNGQPYHRIQRVDTGEGRHKFPQSHFVRGAPGENSTWKAGPPKGELIPYHLPQLLKAKPSEPVFICEGEKDADNVEALGVISTTNVGGAGKWKPELNKWFKGKKVGFILEDNDVHGRRHTISVYENLKEYFEKLCIVSLPGLPLKEDVSWWIENGGTKEQLLEFCYSQLAKVRERVALVIYNGENASAVKDVENALLKAKSAILVRGTQLVEPIWATYPASRGHTVQIGTLKPISPSMLSHILNRDAAVIMRYDARVKKEVPINPPVWLLNEVLEKCHWSFPQVSGTVNAPTMRPDGTIFDATGYDPKTRLWRWNDISTKINIPKKPTRKDALEALAVLKELFQEVPFKGSVDRSVALAAILTTIARGAFDMAPMFLFRAHTPGTGKSYLVDVISHIAQGRWCPVISLRSNADENEKRIGAILLESPPMISLDNLSHDLKGDMLCQMIERPLVRVRILGQSAMPECEWRGTMFATGNNISFVGDMVRRGVTCNIDAAIENPETRKFKFDPISAIQADRGKYIGAALTVVRAFFLAPAKERNKVNCPSLGSFEQWTNFVRKPLIWLGEADPYLSIEDNRIEDPAREQAERLVSLWAEYAKTDEKFRYALRVTDLINKAIETETNPVMSSGGSSYQFKNPELHEILADRAAGSRPNSIDSKRLGWWLRSLMGQIYAGHRIKVSRHDKHAGHMWVLEKVSDNWTGAAGVAKPKIGPVLAKKKKGTTVLSRKSAKAGKLAKAKENGQKP